MYEKPPWQKPPEPPEPIEPEDPEEAYAAERDRAAAKAIEESWMRRKGGYRNPETTQSERDPFRD
jgi:hypothetical protein